MMPEFIENFSTESVVTVNRVVLKPEYDLDDLEMPVAMLCENGNQEVAYELMGAGKAYTPDEAAQVRAAMEKFAA